MAFAFPKARLLPDELVSEILAPCLSISPNRFNDTSSKSPFNAPDHLSTSVIHVVCKQWLRVATPLLYNTVIIRSKRQASSLEETIKSNPSLGTFIRRLRLEGPCGKTLERIVRVSPGIRDLCLCFKVLSEHEGFDVASINTLVKVLPSINPTSFNIDVTPAWSKPPYKNFFGRCPTEPMRIIHVLESGIIDNLSKWTNLVTVQIKLNNIKCYRDGAGCHGSLNTRHRNSVIALGSAGPSVKIVHLGFDNYPPPPLAQIVTMISKNRSIQKIDLHPGSCSYKYPAHPAGSDALRLDTIICINGHSLEERRSRGTFLTPAACAIASRFDDRIWHWIIAHAMAQTISPIHTAYSLMRVCKRFQKLGIPHLYRHPAFLKFRSFTQFLSRICDTPSLHPHVESIKLPPTPGAGLHTELVAAGNTMATTFRLLPNITRLEFNYANDLPLPWEAFEAICETSAGKMTRFRPAVIIKPVDEKLVCINVFQPFRNLTSLRWNSLVGFDMSDEGLRFPSDILSSLVELEYIHTFVRKTRSRRRLASSLLAALCRLELPALRTLVLSGDSCPEAAGFLQCHGAKIERLAFDTRTNNTGILLQSCPSLTSLRIVTADDIGTWSKQHQSMFKSCSFDAHPLQKITISPNTWLGENPVSAKELRPWAKLLDPVVYHEFPALREIQVSQCRWPETESEMKINHWPKISAKLMTANIKLIGEDYRCWVPRMGDTTSSA